MKYDLDKMLDIAFDPAVEVFGKSGGFQPMVFIDFEWLKSGNAKEEEQRKNEKAVSLAVMLASDEAVDARRYVFHALGTAAGLLQMLEIAGAPLGIRMASEAWMSVQENKKGSKLAPSDDPNRIEVLIASGLDHDSQTGIRIKEIKRGRKKRVSLQTPKGYEVTPVAKSKPNETSLSEFFKAYKETMANPPKGIDGFVGALSPSTFIETTIRNALKGAIEAYKVYGKKEGQTT